MSDPYISPADDLAVASAQPVELDDEQTVEDDSVATQTDPRHQKRIDHMQALFAYSFGGITAVEPDNQAFVESVIPELETIDAQIHEVAPERPLTEINKVDLAILRLIVFESRYKKTPKKVLLDEAVELAKAYGTDSSSAFVNAVLGKVVLTTEAPNHDN